MFFFFFFFLECYSGVYRYTCWASSAAEFTLLLRSSSSWTLLNPLVSWLECTVYKTKGLVLGNGWLRQSDWLGVSVRVKLYSRRTSYTAVTLNRTWESNKRETNKQPIKAICPPITVQSIQPTCPPNLTQKTAVTWSKFTTRDSGGTFSARLNYYLGWSTEIGGFAVWPTCGSSLARRGILGGHFEKCPKVTTLILTLPVSPLSRENQAFKIEKRKGDHTKSHQYNGEFSILSPRSCPE